MDFPSWSWLFLSMYVVAMLAFGIVVRNKVHKVNYFSARGSYGPVFLALSLAATSADPAVACTWRACLIR